MRAVSMAASVAGGVVGCCGAITGFLLVLLWMSYCTSHHLHLQPTGYPWLLPHLLAVVILRGIVRLLCALHGVWTRSV